MSTYTTVILSGEKIKERREEANQKTLLFQFAHGGNCIGVYQSPHAIDDGDTWSLTQGTLEWGDFHLDKAHPAAAAAQRELKEELGRIQPLNQFHYFGTVQDCLVSRRNSKNWRAVTDYHFVFSYAEECNVNLNPTEVAKFKWEDVGGCLAALEGFMSPQKAGLVKLGLSKLVEEVEACTSASDEEDEKRVTNPQIARFLSQARWVNYAFDTRLRQAS